MNKCGLTSITFRGLSAESIIENLRKTELKYIEWGSDVHVPEGDVVTAEKVRVMTEKEGINISSYGTYYRLGEGQNFIPYIESAKALNTPILRLWAGTKGTNETDVSTYEKWVAEAKECCKTAEKYGLKIAFEYHPNTLTDDAYSAKKFIEDINEPNCRLYWQPDFKKTMEENLKALETVLPYVEIIHVFFWNQDYTRRFLDEGKSELSAYLKKAPDAIKLLEFVPNDDIDYLKTEAKSLIKISQYTE